MRPSVIVSGRDDGLVTTHDLTFHHNQPIFSNKVADHGITDIKFNPAGDLILASSEGGNKIRPVIKNNFTV